jgi:hypothetical protein
MSNPNTNTGTQFTEPVQGNIANPGRERQIPEGVSMNIKIDVMHLCCIT